MTDVPPIAVSYASPTTPRPGKAARIAGWVLGGLPALALTAGGVTDVLKLDFVVEEVTKAGYPEHIIRPLGVAVVLSGLLYLLPQTAVLGAILLTGYMGGAVCHHVHADDPLGKMLFPTIFAALLWLGLLLRDRRVRELLPLRKV